MSVTYGFYNSLNRDRRYDAIQMGQIFDGIIRDGVYQHVGNALAVKQNNGMMISVDTGRAWFNHTWTYNDSLLPLVLDPSELIANRIDIVILDVNGDMAERKNEIKILKGTPATSPVPPPLISTNLHHQYPLASILVKAGVSSITQSDITNKIGTKECPYVTGVLQAMTIDNIVAQWESQFMDWFTQMESNLEGNPVTNLQVQINKIDRLRSATLTASGWSGTPPYKQTIVMNGFRSGESPFVQCSGNPGSEAAKKQLQKQWGFVDSIEVLDNQIVATCKFKKPSIDLPIVIKGR